MGYNVSKTKRKIESREGKYKQMVRSYTTNETPTMTHAANTPSVRAILLCTDASTVSKAAPDVSLH